MHTSFVLMGHVFFAVVFCFSSILCFTSSDIEILQKIHSFKKKMEKQITIRLRMCLSNRILTKKVRKLQKIHSFKKKMEKQITIKQ